MLLNEIEQNLNNEGVLTANGKIRSLAPTSVKNVLKRIYYNKWNVVLIVCIIKRIFLGVIEFNLV